MMMTSPGFAPYFRQAIESALAQRTTFFYEIVVGDDGSQDGTREMILEYAERYPHIVRPVLHAVRWGTCTGNFLATLAECRGEYVARLDGDDFYLDPLKLQKQADLMDERPEIGFCAHWAAYLPYGKEAFSTLRYGQEGKKNFYALEDFLAEGPGLATGTTMFRRAWMTPPPAWAPRMIFEDYGTWIWLSRRGGCLFLNETLSVYRERLDGVYHGLEEESRWSRLWHDHRIVGRELGLTRNAAWRRGAARALSGIARACREKGKIGAALAATFGVFRYRPLSLWPETLRIFLFLLCPFLYRFRRKTTSQLS